MEIQKNPVQPEIIGFDELGAKIREFQETSFPASVVLFVASAHEHRLPEMSDEEYAQFCKEHPRPTEDEVAKATELCDRATKQFADQLGIEFGEVPGLVAAHRSEKTRRSQNDTVRKYNPEAEDKYVGMSAPYGETHLEAAAAVLTLANLTGESYTVSNTGYHVGPIEEMYSYTVHPGQTPLEVFQ